MFPWLDRDGLVPVGPQYLCVLRPGLTCWDDAWFSPLSWIVELYPSFGVQSFGSKQQHFEIHLVNFIVLH